MQTFVLLLACIVATTLAQQYAVSITHADGSSINGADAVKKGNSIQYKFSLPNAGAGQLTSSCSSATRCYVRVVLTADIARDIGLSQCYLEWYYSTVSGTPTQDLADKIVTVYAKENYIAGGAVHTISAVVETNTQLFANQAQSVQVDTRDSTPSATCTIWGDPHYITFDATGALGQWDATYPIASHVIVAAPYRNFEIQSITKGWGPVEGGNAGVTCAFAAREGNDIVYFNFCTGQTDQGIYAVFNSPKDAQPTVFHSGIRYTINFRSGTQFSVDVNGGATGYLAGYVTVPGSDFKKGLFGACGNFDGDATNDVPTSTTGVRKGFGNNPTTQAQLEAVFGVIVKNYETNPRSLWNWQYDPRNVTVTSAAASECNPAPVSGPTVTTGGKDITALLLVQPGTSTTTTYDVPTDTLTYAALTAEQVQTLCHDKLAGSSLGQACLTSGAISQGAMDVHVQNCVVDIALTGGQASFITDAFLALQTDCLQHVYSGAPGFNFGAWTNANGGSFVCDSACSGNGECVNGVCVCNQGFANTDCSIDTTSTPSIDWISPVNFDVSQTSTFARIHGSAFWSDAAIKINGAAVSSFVYVDSFTVGINVLSAGFSAGDSASVAVTSGSGKTSNAVTITFYDGTCYSAPGVERTDVCFLTTGGCAASGSSACNPAITGTSNVDLSDIVGGARRSAGSVPFSFVAGTRGDSAASWSVNNGLVSIDDGGLVSGTGAAAWKAAGLDLDTYDWSNWANDADAFAHSFTVSVTSTLGLTATHQVSIGVGSQSSVNRAPYFSGAQATVSIPEDGHSVSAAIGAVDPDHDSIDYSVDSASFTVDSNGLLSIASGVNLCCATSFDVVLTATDSHGASSSIDVTVNVDQSANGCTPFDLNLVSNHFGCSAQAGAGSAFSVSENSNVNQAVFASDKDASDSFTFQVTGGDSNGFSFSGNSLQHAAFDFEHPTDANQDNVYVVEVTVTDGNSHSYTQSVSVTVTNVPEAPSRPASNGFISPPESSSNSVIGSVSSVDEAGNPVSTFSISGGYIIDSFGQVTVVSVPNYESANPATLTFTVTALGGNGLNAQASFTVDITDVNEAPSISFSRGSSPSQLPENTVGTSIGSISFSDPDTVHPAAFGVNTVSLSSVNGGACNCFSLSGNTIRSANLNFEALTDAPDGKRYATCVATVSDFGGLSASVTFNVQVTNVNEPPTGVSVASPFVTEFINSTGRVVGDNTGTLIGPLVFADEEDPTGALVTVTAVTSLPTTSRFTFVKNTNNNRWYIQTRATFNYEATPALGAPIGNYQPVGFSVNVSFTDITPGSGSPKYTLALGNPTVGYGIQVKDAPHDFTLYYDNIYVATAKDSYAVGTGVLPYSTTGATTTGSNSIFWTTGFDYTTQVWSVVNSTNKAADGSEDSYFFPGADYLYIQPTIFTTTASYPRTLRLKKSLTTWGKNTIKFTIRLERENVTANALYPGTTNPRLFPQYKTFTLNVTQKAQTYFAYSNASVVYDLGTAANTNIYTFPSNPAYSNYQLVGVTPDFADPDFPVFRIDADTGRISNPDMLNTELTWQLIISVDVSDGSTINGVVNIQVIDKSTAGTGCLNTTAGFSNALPLCISTTVQANCRAAAGTQWMCTCSNKTTTSAKVVDCVRPLASSAAASSASAGTVAGVVVAVVILVAIIVGVALSVMRSRRGKQNISIAGVDSEGQAIVFDKSSYTNSGEVAYDASAAAASEATVATWYHPRMSREECEDYLANLGEGAFVIRESTFTPGWHMMAVKTANTVVHERIKLNADGTFQMLPATNVSQPSFRTMSELVEFYSAGKHDGVAFSLALDNPMYDNHLLREQASMDAAHEPVAVPSTTEADAPLLPSRSGDL